MEEVDLIQLEDVGKIVSNEETGMLHEAERGAVGERNSPLEDRGVECKRGEL